MLEETPVELARVYSRKQDSPTDMHGRAHVAANLAFAVRVVDADAQFRRAACCALVAGGIDALEFASVEQYLASVPDERVGCIVLEPQLLNRLELPTSSTTRASHMRLPVIAVAASATAQEAVNAFKAGVSDFLFKPVDAAELLAAATQAIRACEQQRAAELGHQALRQRFDLLTPKERKVLALMVEGHGNRHIAIALNSAERTIKAHRGNLLAKLETRSLTHLINAYRSVLPLLSRDGHHNTRTPQ